MIIYNYSHEYKTSDFSELEKIMSARHKNGMNEVLLAHDGHKFPLLSILMKDNIAALHYMVEGDRAGFASIGGKLGLPKGDTVFGTGNPDEKIWITNDAVVPFATALTVAKEFFRSEQLPKSIKWLEL
jgi:hypothetical protein